MSRARKKAKKPARATLAAKTKSKAKSKGRSKSKSKAEPGPLYLTEEDVKKLVTVKDAIATLEELFATWSDPATVNLPRRRARAGDSAFNLMGAAWGAKALFGLKAYYIGGGGACSHVLLYSSRDGKLQAMIESDNLGRMRTGAASGLATKFLANPEARTVGVIGTGQQSFTQVAAVCAVRPVETVLVFSPTAAHRDAFADKIERRLRVAARAMPSAEAAVTPADVVIVITKSAEPVLRADWLKSGVHVNAAGANAAALYGLPVPPSATAK